MVRTIIQLTEYQAAELRKKAHEQGVSVSHLMRTCVDKLLASSVSDVELRRRAMDAVGFAPPGPGDMSERHDDYFVEAILDDLS